MALGGVYFPDQPVTITSSNTSNQYWGRLSKGLYIPPVPSTEEAYERGDRCLHYRSGFCDNVSDGSKKLYSQYVNEVITWALSKFTDPTLKQDAEEYRSKMKTIFSVPAGIRQKTFYDNLDILSRYVSRLQSDFTKKWDEYLSQKGKILKLTDIDSQFGGSGSCAGTQNFVNFMNSIFTRLVDELGKLINEYLGADKPTDATHVAIINSIMDDLAASLKSEAETTAANIAASSNNLNEFMNALKNSMKKFVDNQKLVNARTALVRVRLTRDHKNWTNLDSQSGGVRLYERDGYGAQNGDYVYIGVTPDILGDAKEMMLYFDFTNATPSTKTQYKLEYFKNGAWVAVTPITDTTQKDGRRFAQTGVLLVPRPDQTTVNGLNAYWIRVMPTQNTRETVKAAFIVTQRTNELNAINAGGEKAMAAILDTFATKFTPAWIAKVIKGDITDVIQNAMTNIANKRNEAIESIKAKIRSTPPESALYTNVLGDYKNKIREMAATKASEVEQSVQDAWDSNRINSIVNNRFKELTDALNTQILGGDAIKEMRFDPDKVQSVINTATEAMSENVSESVSKAIGEKTNEIRTKAAEEASDVIDAVDSILKKEVPIIKLLDTDAKLQKDGSIAMSVTLQNAGGKQISGTAKAVLNDGKMKYPNEGVRFVLAPEEVGTVQINIPYAEIKKGVGDVAFKGQHVSTAIEIATTSS